MYDDIINAKKRERRLGRICVNSLSFSNDFMKAVMEKMQFVFETMTHYDGDTILMGYSPLFDELEPRDYIPHYNLIVYEDKNNELVVKVERI